MMISDNDGTIYRNSNHKLALQVSKLQQQLTRVQSENQRLRVALSTAQIARSHMCISLQNVLDAAHQANPLEQSLMLTTTALGGPNAAALRPRQRPGYHQRMGEYTHKQTHRHTHTRAQAAGTPHTRTHTARAGAIGPDDPCSQSACAVCGVILLAISSHVSQPRHR